MPSENAKRYYPPRERTCITCWKTFMWDRRAKHCKECNSKSRSENMKNIRTALTYEQKQKAIEWWCKRYDWLPPEEKKKIRDKQIESNLKRMKDSWRIKSKSDGKRYTKNWKINVIWLKKYRVEIYNLFKWKICKCCWKWYYGRNTWKDFCSKECYEKYRAGIWWIWKKICKTCGKEFKPKRAKNSTYCSVQCANRDREINHKTVSDINIERSERLQSLWYSPFLEFPLWDYSYDIQIQGNILIEINPSVFHSFTYSPYWDKYKKDKMYHYNKTQFAIDNWYKCINIRDRTTKNDVLSMIKNDFIYEWAPNLLWCNRRTWELYDHQVEDKYTVWIYDSWTLVFNQK